MAGVEGVTVRRSTRFLFVLTSAVVLVAATTASGSPTSAQSDDDEDEFITPFEHPEGLGPHEAIAPLSWVGLDAGRRAAGGEVLSSIGAAVEAEAGPDVRTTNSAGTQSEISMAATAGGQNVVLTYNGGPQGLGITSSQNGGRTFGAEFSAPVPAGSNPCCDPSVVGDAANTFYLIQLFRDDGATTPNPGNCTNSLHVSTNGGATFGNIVSSPFSYAPGSGQFPDQPHIGIDRTNPGPNLYVTTRHFTSGINCPQTGGGGTVQGEIVCSNDGGATWSNPLVWPQFTDTAHVGVGADGRTYVAGMGIGTNANTTRVILWRSNGTTCPGAGNTPAFTGPTVVADNLTFGASGIDREFVQPDVIVDPTNSNRVFVSYSADSTQGSGDREVFLGTCTFPAGTCTNVTINDNPVDGTQQYFVMTCIDPTSNAIYASWNDARANPNHQIRAATITNNGATVSASQQISDVTWPLINPGGTPDYGDYNENNAACRANHHYAAWTSQLSPPNVTPASTDLDVFFTVVNDPPVANADGPYLTTEGVDVALSGTATDTENDTPFLFEWDFDNDGQFDDATGQAPSFTNVGQDGVFPICLRVTDSIGDSGVSCSTVTVTNVAPTVSGLASNSPRDENTVLTVTGLVSDPGWLDPLTATIDWGDGAGPQPISGTLENVRPNATLTFSADHIYGDDGVFAVTVCGSDDDTTTCAPAFNVVVNNVNPTATIDESGTTLVNGIPTIILHAGETITFSGRSTDPGSDDLTLSWDFDDGPPAPDVSTIYLVNPPATDPDPSPTVQPRDVTDTVDHAFADACIYQVGFSAADDDGGSATDSVAVLITGNEDRGRPSGYWSHQYRRQGSTDFDDATLTCYLEIVNFVSAVFHEVRDVSTFPLARSLLFTQNSPVNKRDQLDRDLLTAWLNFANGAVEWDEAIAGTIFHVAMETAEAVRLNPASTDAEFDQQRQILQRIISSA
jgi:hypothetical protein